MTVRLTLLIVAGLVACSGPQTVAPGRQHIAFVRPSPNPLWTGPEPGTAVLRTSAEWEEFARRHRREGSTGDASVPAIDFKRFMVVALWRPGVSGCVPVRNWVDSVTGDRDSIRVFASPPPAGSCQALQNAFDAVCLPQDDRKVRFIVGGSIENYIHPKKSAEPTHQGLCT
jgi:hypothetical protein